MLRSYNRFTPLLFPFIFCIASFSPSLSMASPPIEIRFSAAIVSHKKNYQANQPFDSMIESAGYDIVWRGKIINTIFQHDGGTILHGSGSTKNTFKIGGGTCSGTLRVNDEMSAIAPLISSNSGGIVKMNIALPHIAANNGQTALLMDKNQDIFSLCRTANASLPTATCFNPTRDCYTLDGTISPGFPAPGDSTKLGKFYAHLNNAYFEFSDENPNTSFPFFYSATDNLYDHEGNQTDSVKNVWVGFLSITTNVGTSTPPPFDPFSFFNYDPATLGGPPADPPVPSGNPHNPNAPSYDVRDLNSWIGNIKNSITSFINGVRGFFGGSSRTLPAVVPVNGKKGFIGTFDDESGLSLLPAESIKTPPATGDIQIRIKTRNKEKAKGYKLRVTKNTMKNKIYSGQPSALSFELDKSVRQALKKNGATVAFVTIKFTPAVGKKGVEKQYKIQIPKRRK